MRETNKARQAFEDYYALGPGRSLRKLVQRYNKDGTENPPTKHLNTLAKWSKAHNWQERVKGRDEEIARAHLEHLKETATETGYALFYKRIGDLNEIAELLRQEIFTEEKRWLPDVKQIGSGEEAERVDILRFNAALIREFRGILEDIAAEMGERVKGIDMTIAGEEQPEKYDVYERVLARIEAQMEESEGGEEDREEE